MQGWSIGVYRFADAAAVESLASVGTGVPDEHARSLLWNVTFGEKIAMWQTGGYEGLDWIRALTDAGKAVKLPSNGYPNRFFARAGDLLPVVAAGPPHARKHWVFGPTDVITPDWAGKTVIDHDAAAACPDREWLLIDAWDES